MSNIRCWCLPHKLDLISLITSVERPLSDRQSLHECKNRDFYSVLVSATKREEDRQRMESQQRKEGLVAKSRLMAADDRNPLQGDFPEVIEEYLEHGCMKCIAFNHRGTLLAAVCDLVEFVGFVLVLYMAPKVQGKYYYRINPLGEGVKWRRTFGQEIYSPLLLAFAGKIRGVKEMNLLDNRLCCGYCIGLTR
ncbi:hypothetical protein VNO80_17381 [Phaseolus coccineus]|uniref:Uncharacterized protein n=1 Tax=Phaseolus coccineus TaxID=3886 RepID=A0AAN9MHE5_PHACN